MKVLRILTVLLLALVIAGCGGGGGSDALPTTANVLASIDWAARTRGLKAPSSAQSVVITLKDALPGGGDFHFLINRDAAPAAYTQTYTSPGLAKLGTWTMSAMFYGQNDGSGDAVGTAGAVVEIKADGTGLPTVATAGTFKTVSIPAGQTATIGTNQDLTVMAGTADSNGAIVKEVAISPGSIVWKVIEGGDKLTFVDGMAKGIAPGVAKITATVDGIVSAAQTVTVVSTATIAISPAVAVVLPGATQTFTANIANVPDNSIVWSSQLIESSVNISGFPANPPPGNITTTGVYTAPTVVGTYKVVATSKYDPGKSASAIVTVPSPVLALTVQTTDMVYDPVSDRLYASLSGNASSTGNSIVIINPATDGIEATIPVGSQPTKLALSDDGTALYIYLDGSKSIVRFDIPSKKVGVPFELVSKSSLNQYKVTDMAVAPGHPELLAVSGGGQEGLQNVSIYQNGIALPGSPPFYSAAPLIAFGADSTRIFAVSDFVYRLSVTNLGASIEDSRRILNFGSGRIQFANGRLYTGSGEVYDGNTLEQIGVIKPTNTNSNSTAHAYPAINKALRYDNFGAISLYNLNDFTLSYEFNFGYLIDKTGSFQSGQAGSLIYSGGKSLTVRTENKVYILNPAPGL